MDNLSEERMLFLLKKTRIYLLREYPFFGFWALQGNLILTDELPLYALAMTDGKAYYFSKSTIIEYRDFLHIIFIHEVLHNQLEHFQRLQNRVWSLWLIATDLAINSIIKDKLKLPLPRGVLYGKKFAGLSAEMIYEMIHREINPIGNFLLWSDIIEKLEEASEQTYKEIEEEIWKWIMREIKEIIKRLELPENARVCGNLPDKSIRDPAKTKEIQKKIIELIHHAVIYAKGRGIFPAELERYVDELLQPKLDLAETLNLFAYRIGKGMEDYSFYRKNRRENELILPAAIGIERHIVIAIDTSGSIDDETLKIFLSEASALKDNKTKITFVTVDAKAYEPVEISEYDDFYDTIRDAHAIRGGGGTDFRDFFDFLKTLTTPVDGVIFFTDGDAEYPNKEDEPPYPVLWIITMRTNLNVPPFGETFYFDLRD